MPSNRNHAETLMHCLEQYVVSVISAREGVATKSMVEQTRGFLILAIEMTLNDLVERPGGN